MIPFPNLFPPPEIWDKIPPLSSRKRKLGILREAGILVTAAGAVIYAGSLGIAKLVDMKDEPAPRDPFATDITNTCHMTGTANIRPHGFDISVVIEEDPVGSKEKIGYGPLALNRTAESAGRLSIFAGDLLDEAQFLQKVDPKTYRLDTTTLPDGPHTYHIYNQHDVSGVPMLGPVPLSGRSKGVSYDPCGSVWINIQQGSLAEVKITDS